MVIAVGEVLGPVYKMWREVPWWRQYQPVTKESPKLLHCPSLEMFGPYLVIAILNFQYITVIKISITLYIHTCLWLEVKIFIVYEQKAVLY